MSLNRSWAALVVAAASAVAAPQSSVPSVQRTYAIVNARIEVGNGTVIPKGSILISNGIIAAVGPGIAIPKSAEIYDASGLTVYPGFIDAYTTKGLKLPAGNPAQDNAPATSDYASAVMRDANRSKTRAELNAASYLAIDDGFSKPYRNAGFTTAMLIPEPALIGGVGALVDLGRAPLRNSVVAPSTAMSLGFGGQASFQNPPTYPGTVLGAIALIRQTFLDVQWQEQVERSFRAGGAQRPVYDETLAAMRPVLAGTLPAVFEANGRYEIVRALDICQEFGLHPILAGSGEAFKEMDRIKRVNSALLVSLAFADEPKEPGKDEKATKDDPGDEPEPPEKLSERKRLFQESLQNALSLSKAGLSFAFTTKGAKSVDEFMTNLRRIVKEGFPKDLALRSLTLNPAQIYGLDKQMGSVEAGKIANLVVWSGDFLDEKSKSKMLYIDGIKIDPSRETVTPVPAAPSHGEGR